MEIEHVIKKLNDLLEEGASFSYASCDLKLTKQKKGEADHTEMLIGREDVYKVSDENTLPKGVWIESWGVCISEGTVFHQLPIEDIKDIRWDEGNHEIYFYLVGKIVFSIYWEYDDWEDEEEAKNIAIALEQAGRDDNNFVSYDEYIQKKGKKFKKILKKLKKNKK